jgi:hypothetical protein
MYRLLLVPLFLLLVACPALSGPLPPAKDAAPLQREATVVFVQLEGGFYGLVTADGHRYDPTNLPESMRRDGLKVQFTARPLLRTAGTHMWGQRIELLDIHPR